MAQARTLPSSRHRAPGPRHGGGVAPGCWALLLLASLGGACASERPRPLRPANDLYDPNPSVRAQAAGEAARMGSVELVAPLIELLDDEDGTVRLTTGQALRDLTGRESGYRAYAPPAELRRQVADWRAWWATQPVAASRRAARGPALPGSLAGPGVPRSQP